MFDILFGWRKASKCKKLIMRAQCRLKLLKNKRCCIVRQLREDVAELLKNGHQDVAFKRAEQLFKDESIVAVYELLDHFCEFITIHLSYIRRHKDCPNDINEAISSLIFASARCGDLPELRAIRKLFGERYGQKFAVSAVELYPGNLVNCQVKENLSIKSVSDDMKHRLVDEIARSNSLQQRPLALEYSSELQQQQMKEYEMQASNVKEYEIARSNSLQQQPLALEYSSELQQQQMKEYEMQASNVKEMDGKAIFVDSSTNKEKIMSGQCHSYQDSGISCSTSSSSVVSNFLPRKSESQMHQKAEKVENFPQPYSPFSIRSHCSIDAAALEQEKERVDAKSSSESSYQFPEEEVVYLDDIEEFQSPRTKDSSCQDQRLFMFSSFRLPKGEIFEADHNESSIEQYDSWNKEGSGRSRKTEKAVRKKLRKRSMHQENQNIKDIEYEVYYDGSFNSSPDHGHRSQDQRKHQKKIIKNARSEGVGSNFVTGKGRHDQLRSYSRGSHNCELAADCSLENPCYFSASDGKDKLEVPAGKQKRMTTLFQDGEPKNPEMKRASLPQKDGRNHKSGATLDGAHSVHQPQKQSKKAERVEGRSDNLGSQGSCNGTMTSPRTKMAESPYLRAMTMPPERTQDNCTDNILRSNSFPLQQPNHLSHVHPKLPDYDDLEAKFTALKKAYLQTKEPTTTSLRA
ncbi:hypothetical protein PVL29_015464 [Vitis rotundifolia]|uniref:Regulator of Vps4 activity in the MVB pathway protein n=1 Tax=Vitis rotundifolia TaxID=103349 RepID=A0AA39DLP3_VITRO|nr:hypothetical protein PVL29_015464 [Vitis rotundifolia]